MKPATIANLVKFRIRQAGFLDVGATSVPIGYNRSQGYLRYWIRANGEMLVTVEDNNGSIEVARFFENEADFLEHLVLIGPSTEPDREQHPRNV